MNSSDDEKRNDVEINKHRAALARPVTRIELI